MKALLREPLLHFLLLGAGLFALHAALDRDDADTRTIVVDRGKLLTYLQYRSRAFNEERMSEVLDELSGQDLQQLVESYVREEALYREATALQLDRNDYIARLRLIQQLEFVLRGIADPQPTMTEQDLQLHYETNRTYYAEGPKVTFTHIFFSQQLHGMEVAEQLAREKLEELDDRTLPTVPAGDPFLYRTKYVAQGPEAVAGRFGTEMQEALFALEPDDGNWRGPFKSPYGFHLVLLTDKEPGRIPHLEDVREDVVRDARRTRLDERFEQAVRAVVKSYDVDVRPDIRRQEER